MTIPKRTACFSGYRPEKFSYPLEKGGEKSLALCRRIGRAIELAVDHGYGTFLCGMAKGFDLLAGEKVMELKAKRLGFGKIQLIAVVPFEHHGFSGFWGGVHKVVASGANQVITLSPNYYQKVYHDRNRYMVERSSLLICYYDGQEGGTAHTVSLAEEKGLEIVNLVE